MVTYWVSFISMRGDFVQAKVHKIQAQKHTHTHMPKHFCKTRFDMFKIPADRSSFESSEMLYP